MDSDSESTQELFFFEGTEKLLEIWFSKSSQKYADKNDLRKIPRTELVRVLDLVNCKILSSTHNKDLDSYVLSESSCFISKRRFLLKTCGTTTLLYAVKPIIELAQVYCGFDTIDDVFYSRKKFAKPELQKEPHTHFDAEVNFLQEVFGGAGAAYALGRLNSECWYLYTLDKPKSIAEPDQTFEIIMTKLDPQVMNIFTKESTTTAEEATQKSGIDKIFPNAVIDAYLFDPCGYSCNAILPGGHYFTIHITPESHCSYVSFETNLPVSNYPNLIKKVVQMFKPGQFIFTLCANDESTTKDLLKKSLNINGFKRDEFQLTAIKNYDVTYAHYTKSQKLPI
jgi:S-adenosylmethionine decarboxylase